MSGLTFLEKVKLMPPDYQQEIKDFIDFVWEKKMGLQDKIDENERIPGLLKGKMWMSADFDETPQDFKDYMGCLILYWIRILYCGMKMIYNFHDQRKKQ